jgi:hypothetical protein
MIFSLDFALDIRYIANVNKTPPKAGFFHIHTLPVRKPPGFQQKILCFARKI